MMNQYCLEDDVMSLRSEILSHGGLTGEVEERNQLGVSRLVALDEFDAYASCFNLGNPEIAHKYSHTLRVTQNAEEIGTRAICTGTPYDRQSAIGLALPSGWMPDQGACFLIGLLHDLGRFTQYAMYRMYSDLGSFSHAEMSYAMLHDLDMMSKFVGCTHMGEGERRLAGYVMDAVRFHSLLEVNESDPVGMAYCDIIRDADKMDLLEACCHAFSNPQFDALVAGMRVALDDGGALPSVSSTEAPFVRDMAERGSLGFAVSDDVVADIMRGGLVDKRHVRTAGDSILMTVALYSGIGTRVAREILDERGTMPALAWLIGEKYGPEDPTGRLSELVGVIVGRA